MYFHLCNPTWFLKQPFELSKKPVILFIIKMEKFMGREVDLLRSCNFRVGRTGAQVSDLLAPHSLFFFILCCANIFSPKYF